MSVSSTFLLFIVGAGILQGVFLASLLVFHPKSERAANKFLALYILGYCIPMLTPVVQYFYSWQMLAFIDPILLLLGPFLYLYVCSFREKITFKKAWPHFLPFVLLLGYDTHLYFVFSDQYPLSSQIPPEVPKMPSRIARVSVRIGQMTAYFFLASRALTSYQRSIQHLFSETSKINLAWVRWLINGYIALLLIMISLYLLILRNPENFGLIILINTAIVTPYLYAVAYRGLTQPTLWQVRHEMTKDNHHDKTQEVNDIEELIHSGEPKNQKAALNQERIADIAAGVTALMKETKLYLQSELTLQDLADKLDIPSYQVTQAINEGLRKNFYDLVNGYRVDEAKRLLQDPISRNSKILSVGMDAGFNSKTTFNTVFKKFTGLTPSEFKEQQQKDLIQA
jgi:AraC-like DNA-binding protein